MLWFWLILIFALIIFATFKYYKMLHNKILDRLVVLDKIFEERYDALSKSIAQFQKYLPEEKNLIFNIQSSKADVAKSAKPKTIQDLAVKIVNENSLTLNINLLLSKCNFRSSIPDLDECLLTQAKFIQKINAEAQIYNQLLDTYKTLKELFPFKYYSKMIHMDLNIDKIIA